MAKKKITETEVESFKNISKDKKVVEIAKFSNEMSNKKTQEKAKKNIKSDSNTIETTVIQPQEEPKKDICTTVEDVIETTTEIQLQEESPKDICTTIEDVIETTTEINETVEKVEKPNVVKKEQASTNKPYSMKEMFGYDWMGVCYGE